MAGALATCRTSPHYHAIFTLCLAKFHTFLSFCLTAFLLCPKKSRGTFQTNDLHGRKTSPLPMTIGIQIARPGDYPKPKQKCRLKTNLFTPSITGTISGGGVVVSIGNSRLVNYSDNQFNMLSLGGSKWFLIILISFSQRVANTVPMRLSLSR